MNPQADIYFQRVQKSADTATPKLKTVFQQMMREIAKEMNEQTQFITDIEAHRKSEFRSPPPKVLDLCMAPGGFTEEVREGLSPLTEINGITLPVSLGGHDLLVNEGPRLKVEFLDITMLAAEMGFTIDDIRPDHPDRNSFYFDRPFFGQRYDLILCDGQVLRTHKRQEYRERYEAIRLSVSQLVFALQRIKTGGTFVMLLHKAEILPILRVIRAFNQFSSSVRLFKPVKKHAMRSSFYLVAKGVDPQSAVAMRVVKEWKEHWASSTLHFATWEEKQATVDEVESILAEFGEKFIELCEPMWKIQSDALALKLKNGFSTSNLIIV